MKDFVKDGQKLPLYGIGPRLVFTMAAVAATGIILFCNILKIGVLRSPWILIFWIAGGVLIAFGILIWSVGALRSDMDENISENRLKTDGIYAWVRNPMYSGWWMLITGISLMWHNAWLPITLFINWGLMTAVLKNTEEKWLKNLYGKEYEDYCKHVNRCVPWKRIGGTGDDKNNDENRRHDVRDVRGTYPRCDPQSGSFRKEGCSLQGEKRSKLPDGRGGRRRISESCHRCGGLYLFWDRILSV